MKCPIKFAVMCITVAEIVSLASAAELAFDPYYPTPTKLADRNDTLYPTKEAAIGRPAGDKHNGASPALVVDRTRARVLLQFDPSNIPGSITAGKLVLFATDPANSGLISVHAHRGDDSGRTEGAPLGSASANGVIGNWAVIPLTASTVDGWRSKPATNYGIVLKGGYLTMASKEHADAARRPFLLINETTHVSPAADTTVVESQANNYGGHDTLTLNTPGTFDKATNNNVLMKFTSLGSTPITNAKLCLYVNGGFGVLKGAVRPDPTISVYSVLSANGGWVEGTSIAKPQAGACCWAKKAYNTSGWAGGASGCGIAGKDHDAVALGAFSYAADRYLVSIPLNAGTLNSWRASKSPQHGMVLEGGRGAFASNEYIDYDSCRRPYLDVTSSTSRPSQVKLTRGPRLFVDEYLIAKRLTSAVRTVNHPTKYAGNPLIGAEASPASHPDKCWQAYMTLLHPEPNLYRLWYQSSEDIYMRPVAYMTSTDGITDWRRPHTLMAIPRADKKQVFMLPNIVDEGAAFRPASQRYKMGYNLKDMQAIENRSTFAVAASPDGLSWSPMDGNDVHHDWDGNSFFKDTINNQYVAIPMMMTPGPTWPKMRRTCFVTVSRDCKTWETPWRLVTYDASEDTYAGTASAVSSYELAGVIARGDLLVGLFKVLYDDYVAPGCPPGTSGIGYTVLMWSRDGRHWERDKAPFLDRSSTRGDWDYGHAWADEQLIVGHTLRIYYGGYRWSHKNSMFANRQIGLATMPVDRYVGWLAGADRAAMQTVPLLLGGATSITVNANIQAGGDLSVRILNAVTDEPLPGFGWNDFNGGRPMSGDSVAHRCTWTGNLSSIGPAPVSLEFTWTKGQLYAFSTQ